MCRKSQPSSPGFLRLPRPPKLRKPLHTDPSSARFGAPSYPPTVGAPIRQRCFQGECRQCAGCGRTNPRRRYLLLMAATTRRATRRLTPQPVPGRSCARLRQCQSRLARPNAGIARVPKAHNSIADVMLRSRRCARPRTLSTGGPASTGARFCSAPAPVALPDGRSAVVRDLWPAEGPVGPGDAPVGLPGKWVASCRRCGAEACGFTAWRALLRRLYTGEADFEDGTHALQAVAGGYQCSG